MISRLAKSWGFKYLQNLDNFAYITLHTDSTCVAADDFRVNCKAKLARCLYEKKDESVLVSNGDD